MFWKNALWILFLMFGLTAAQVNHQCYGCDGEQCTQDASELQAIDCGVTSDKCFTNYTNYLPTQRGCVSKITDDGLKAACSSTTDRTCSVCDGSNCNILAHEDHTCLYCSTLLDSNCLTNPEKITSVRCSAPTGSSPLCYVKAMGSVTERGCLTASENIQNCLNDDLCGSCSIDNDGSSCNNYEFPDDRRKCFHCSGDQCKTGDDTLEYCNTWNDNCVTVNAKGIFKKGCQADMDEVSRDYCTEYPNHCLQCASSECNSGLHYYEKTQCRSCSSDDNANCIENPTAVPEVPCQNGCATIVEPNLDEKLSTKRMCYEDLSQSEKQACGSANLDSVQCEVCGTDSCNSKIFPKDRLSCFHCDEAPCNTQATVKSAICPFYKENDVCVAFRKNGAIESLTCQSSLSDSDEYLCDYQETLDGRSCEKCSGPNCNDPAVFQSAANCLQCDSSTNKLCSTNPGALVSTPCQNADESACYTENVGDVVKRGCLSDLSAAEQTVCNAGTTYCLTCKEATGCNKVLHPEDRIKCHQCDSASNAACRQIEGFEPQVCDTLDSSTQCFTIVEETGAVTRKCSKNSITTECGDAVYCKACSLSGCNEDFPDLEYPTEPEIVRPTLAPDVTTTAATTTNPSTASPPLTVRPSNGSSVLLFSKLILLVVLIVVC